MTDGNINSPPEVSAPRRKAEGRFHHGDLPGALLAAASALIVERGSAEFSLREVAERVGVSHTAAYRHFASKRALLADLACRGFQRLHRDMVADRATAQTPQEALQRIGLGYVSFALAEPGAYRIMFHVDLCATGEHPALEKAAYDGFAEMVSVIAEGQALGQFRQDRRAEELATALWSAQHGYTSLLLDGQIAEGPQPPGLPGFDIAPPADRALMVQMMLAGLKAP
ncbi:MAG: TetR/AcrR family transcriptional regulator [Elstera sp.]